MKILIIDDETDICYILGIELKSMGHEPVSFSNISDAINYLEDETPDAILCDFQMPRMNGLELFLWLKEQGKSIPFYIITGEPMMDTKILIGNGVKDILFKPQDLLHLSDYFK